MHASVVLMVALAGLGCQNKSSDASVAPAGYYATSQSAPHVHVHVHAGSAGSTGYPAGAASHPGHDHDSGYDLHSSIRSTLWSFVLGHDPDGVRTVAEIEAGLESGAYGASAYAVGY